MASLIVCPIFQGVTGTSARAIQLLRNLNAAQPMVYSSCGRPIAVQQSSFLPRPRFSGQNLAKRPRPKKVFLALHFRAARSPPVEQLGCRVPGPENLRFLEIIPNGTNEFSGCPTPLSGAKKHCN